MIKNEPSDRKDRRIQRAKCRQMLRELEEEKARMYEIVGPVRTGVRYSITTSGQRQRALERRGNLILASIAAAAVILAVVTMVIR